MADNDSHNLADALTRFANGDVAPSETEPPHGLEFEPVSSSGAAELASTEAAVPSANFPRAPLPPGNGPLPISTIGPITSAVDLPLLDDDAVIVPAPDVEVFIPKSALSQRAAVYQTIQFRRTVIPILLVCGLLLVGFASAKTFVGPDSLLSDLPSWLAPVLFTTGLLLLALAVLNMLSVKQHLDRHSPKTAVR